MVGLVLECRYSVEAPRAPTSYPLAGHAWVVRAALRVSSTPTSHSASLQGLAAYTSTSLSRWSLAQYTLPICAHKCRFLSWGSHQRLPTAARQTVPENPQWLLEIAILESSSSISDNLLDIKSPWSVQVTARSFLLPPQFPAKAAPPCLRHWWCRSPRGVLFKPAGPLAPKTPEQAVPKNLHPS